MTPQTFSLKPFQAFQVPLQVEFSGTFSSAENLLRLQWTLSGDLAALKWAAAELASDVVKHERLLDLWKTTCFECFFKIKNGPEYFEVNLSPNLSWNIFHLSDYRSQLREEPALMVKNQKFRKTEKQAVLTAEIDLNPLLVNCFTNKIKMGVAAVIEPMSGPISYWALHHSGKQPDYHHAESFVLELSEDEAIMKSMPRRA